MPKFYNNKAMKQRRMQLRNHMPESEKLLWNRIRKHQIRSVKFRRQHSIGPYVVDFYAAKERLAIEIDGSSHNNQEAKEYDTHRQVFIEACGITILRFTNNEIQTNINEVIQTITKYLPPSPSPHVRGR